MQMVSCVTKDELGRLTRFILSLPGEKREWLFRVTYRLSKLSPADRLASNLRVLLGLMKERDVQGVIPDGLTQDELRVLTVLQTQQAPAEIQETAQGLFNVYERYQLHAAVASMFRKERRRAAAGEGSYCQSNNDNSR
jgi:hypothetical protein